MNWLITAPILLSLVIFTSSDKLEEVKSSALISQQIITHKNYTVSYNRVTKLPNWVSWSIPKDELNSVVSRSGFNFSSDHIACHFNGLLKIGIGQVSYVPCCRQQVQRNRNGRILLYGVARTFAPYVNVCARATPSVPVNMEMMYLCSDD